MTRIANKTTRLLDIEALLLDHPEGLTRAELARRLGVHRSTIARNLPDVPAQIYEDNGRLFLDRSGDLLRLNLSLHEALALHLAARLLASSLDRQNAHAAAALRKISQAMQRLAPPLSRYVAASAEEIDQLARFDDPTTMRILETLTEGWAGGRKVRIWRRPSPGGPLQDYLLSPYTIEPSAWGRSTYVIGLREPPGELRTLKIERLAAAELTGEIYRVPPDFEPLTLLHDAWGIWYTGVEPQEVTLRFSERVAGRVRETHWHPSQRLEPCPDGRLIWRAQVASLLEMLPWIRGWGADCEALGPPELRARLREEALALGKMYGEEREGE